MNKVPTAPQEMLGTCLEDEPMVVLATNCFPSTSALLCSATLFAMEIFQVNDMEVVCAVLKIISCLYVEVTMVMVMFKVIVISWTWKHGSGRGSMYLTSTQYLEIPSPQ